MQHKNIIILLILLLASLIYSISVLMDDSLSSAQRPTNAISQSNKQAKPVTQAQLNQRTINKIPTKLQSSSEKPHVIATSNENDKLPIRFLLVGTETNDDASLARIMIEYEGQLYTYMLEDMLLEEAIILKQIFDDKVTVEYQNNMYEIPLTGSNLLLKKKTNDKEEYTTWLNMTPKEIGARPRIIEHLATLIPTPYIADGVIIEPGLNPELFEQAGFQADDVLKKINGKSVTLADEFAAIKEEIKTAHTLEFEVMRKGRMVTLYLDIPSETLKLTKDI